MFAELFNEEIGVTGTSQVHADKKSVIPIPTPPPGRSNIGFCGIKNQGATCYLNSLLQTLFMTPEFRRAMMALDDLGDLSDPDRARLIPLQLQRLFTYLHLSDISSVSTTDLTNSFGWTTEDFVQQDVQELNRVLFSALEMSLKGTKGEHLIKNLYHGTIEHTVECQQCHHVSCTKEDYLDLAVSITGHCGLEEALTDSFVATETLSGDNRYKCEKCNQLVDAVRTSSLVAVPQILTFSILRFSFDIQKLQKFKETSSFSFPSTLNMSSFSKSTNIYDLFSVVIHRGSASGGHYHAYINDLDGKGRWPLHQELKVKGDVLDHDDPIQVLKVLLEDSVGQQSIDQLCSNLLKRTGVSWNRRYKNSHGPLLKFLHRHDNVFDLDEANKMVGLKTSSTKSVPTQGHWYDFDDSGIRPIQASDIDRQFKGKESAYMLFYRSRSLAENGSGDSGFSSPFAEEVTKFNLELQAQRSQYLDAVNNVTFCLHFGQMYSCGKGAMQPLTLGVNKMEIKLDQRSNLKKLYQEIKESCGVLVNFPFVIHTCKELPAGLHIYEYLSEKSETTLESIFAQKFDLIVWDGVQIGGQVEVLIGKQYEPCFVTLTYNPQGHAQDWAIPKCYTLLQLKDVFSGVTGTTLSNVKLFRGHSYLPLVDETLTLQQLGIKDGEVLFTDTCLRSDCGCLAPMWEEKVNVKVDVSTKDEKTQVFLQPTLDTTILELKTMAISTTATFSLLGQGLLKVLDDDLGPRAPLQDTMTVRAAGIKDGSRLLLSDGSASADLDFTLRYRFSNITKVIKVSRWLLVHDLVTLIGQQLELDNIHLQATNYFEEVKSLMTNLDITLEQAGIKDGDLVIVQNGQTGLRTVKIFTADNLTKYSGEPLTLILLGEVEVMEAMTLGELKQRLITSYCLRHIRLRLVSKTEQKSRVLRPNNHTIKQLQLTNQTRLLMEVTDKEEELKLTEVLIQIGFYEDAFYQNIKEVVIDKKVSLEKQLAMIVDIQDVKFAKHERNQHKWLSPPKSAQLKDGDFLGIKLKQEDDNFQTVWDLAQGTSSENSSSTNSPKKKVERGIHIYVKDYDYV